MQLGKIFIAATIGVVVGGYVEPFITPHIPASVAQTKIGPLAIHALVGGATTVGVYWAIAKVA